MVDALATVKAQIPRLCPLLPQIWGLGCGLHPGSQAHGYQSPAPYGGLIWASSEPSEGGSWLQDGGSQCDRWRKRGD